MVISNGILVILKIFNSKISHYITIIINNLSRIIILYTKNYYYNIYIQFYISLFIFIMRIIKSPISPIVLSIIIIIHYYFNYYQLLL